ncbi:MAG: DUF3375 domain-containing protein [Succinivibrionaceae bacterium]
MNFFDDYNSLSILLQENKTWRLLRADNAPLIIAFLKNIFNEEREVSYDTARAKLKEFLDEYRLKEDKSEGRQAGDYLREWMDRGWILEMNNNVIMTDAAQKAISFCKLLKNNTVSTSATHLQMLQNEIRQFCIDIQTDSKVRVAALREQRDELDQRIKLISAGKDRGLTEAEKKERVRVISDLAFRLPQDFRHLEEETRAIDRDIRIKMIETGGIKNVTKGDVLKHVLKEEQRQRKTDYGAAYDGFFRLICDHDSMAAFKRQMEYILSHEVSRHLSREESDFLRRFIDVLVRECDRVHSVRSRIDENLRVYIESSDFQENLVVEQLLTKLEKQGINLRKKDVNLRTELKLNIDTGAVSIQSPTSFIMKTPDEITDYSSIEEHENSQNVSSRILRNLDLVRMSEVRRAIVKTLGKASEMSVGEIIGKNNIRYGLQEVVAYVRAAGEFMARGVAGEFEDVEVQDCRRPGKMLRIRIPLAILSSQDVRSKMKEKSSGDEV